MDLATREASGSPCLPGVGPVASFSAPPPPSPALRRSPALQAEFASLDEGIRNIQGGKGKSEASN